MACNGIVGTATGAEAGSMMKQEAAVWLEARGLDPELAAKMGWEGGTGKDGKEWVKIPYIRDGKHLTTQYRCIEEKLFRFDKGSETELWNVDVLKDDTLQGHPLIITEGAFDALAIMQCGYQRVVAVPGWTDSKGSHEQRYSVFKRNEALIKRAGLIIAAVDADNVGRSLLHAIANFFEECDVCYVTWPEGCKDANDVLKLHGPEAVVSAVTSARSMDPQGGLITGFSDLPPRPERQMWKVGQPDFDGMAAFRTREISVLTGIPGAGKTTMATWLMEKLVQKHGIRVGMGLFETDATEMFDQLVRLRTGGRETLADLDKFERQDMAKKLDENYRIFHRIEDDEDTPHGMLWLRQMIHKLAARDGCNIIVIDPWNELEHMLEPGESMTNYINLALKRLREWADKYDIHILLVAHPKKLEPGQEPTGYSIADSAAFFNKPGFGYTIHNVTPRPKVTKSKGDDDDEGEDKKAVTVELPYIKFATWKVRNRQETGCKPRYIKLSFNEHLMSYSVIS